MIRLFVENPGQANPNLALRWCVDKETLDELKAKGVKNPQLFLMVVIRREHYWQASVVERKLVPLGQAMEYLEFNKPGRHTIYTTIVWDSEGEKDFKAQMLLRRGFGGLEWEKLDSPGFLLTAGYGAWSLGRHSLDEGSLDVVVAKEFFAKEPPAWLNWWVNLWFDALNVPRPPNQCSFRKRKWFIAFPIQPIPVFIWVLLNLLVRLVTAVVLALCGMRGVSFKPVIHPFELCLGNVWCDMGSSVFLKDKHGKEHSLLLFFVMPIVPVSLFVVLSIVNLFLHFGFWLAVVGAVGLVVGIAALVSLADFLIYVAGSISRGLRTIWRALLPPPSAKELERKRLAKEKRDRERWEKKAAERDRKERERRERGRREFEAFYGELRDVACIGVPLKPKIELLPEKRRTFHLRYMNLKAKVCKPFAR